MTFDCCFCLGSVPGPIAFGSVIDLSCLLWQDKCGEQGSCYLYQNSAMSQYTLVTGIIYKVIITKWIYLCFNTFLGVRFKLFPSRLIPCCVSELSILLIILLQHI